MGARSADGESIPLAAPLDRLPEIHQLQVKSRLNHLQEREESLKKQRNAAGDENYIHEMFPKPAGERGKQK